MGRDDRIGTRDILYPKTKYQAALHPFQLVYSGLSELEAAGITRTLFLFSRSFFLYRYRILLAISFFFLSLYTHTPAAPINAY